MKRNSLAALALLFAFCAPALAADERTDKDEFMKPDFSAKRTRVGEKYRPVTSIEGYSELGHHTANSLGLAADYANMNSNYDQAIKLCRRAVNKNFNNMEVHQTLAEALENKLSDQADKDPELFNECVREWVIVLRQEVGDERGMTFHGIGIPGLGTLFADEDQTMTARHHLVRLCGQAPHSWETDMKYMKRVAMQGTGSVTGKILSATKGTKAVDMH